MTRQHLCTALFVASATLLGAYRDQSAVAPMPLPGGSQPMVAPDMYARWWAQTEACSGRKGIIRRVSWFVVPNSEFFWYDGGTYDGYWFRYHHQIILASASVPDSAVVRHEMLHDLLDDGSHPREYFGKRCAGIVAQRSGSDLELR